MPFKKVLLLAVSTLMIAGPALAQNKDANDALTPQPVRSKGTQIFLGLVDIWAAETLFNSLNTTEAIELKKQLAASQTDLKNARALSTPADIKSEIANVKAELANTKSTYYNAANGVSPEAAFIARGRIPALQNELAALERASLSGVGVDPALKAAEIATATEKVNLARKDLLLLNKSAFKQGVKGVKIVGGSLFVMDMVGRVYVWNAIEDGNPGISPLPSAARAIFKE